VSQSTRYAHIIDPIRDQMLAIVWRLLRTPHDAEDAFHTALTRLWERWVEVEAHPNPQALTLKICTETAIDHLRKRQREAARRDFDAATLESLPSWQLIPPEVAMQNEALHEISSAIARLPDQQALSVAMRLVQGAAYEEIAAALGCSEATVRTHVARGRETLARWLCHLDPRTSSSRA
jgi:RNA polymerase sigma-70 factor (ECF subfamily)